MMFRVGVAICGAVVGLSAAVRVSEKAGNWLLENPQLVVTVSPAEGRVSVWDKAARKQWSAAPSGAFHYVRTVKGGVTLARDSVLVTLTLPEEGGDLHVEMDMANRASPIETVPGLEPFPLSSPDAAVVVADYCNGHLYPLDGQLLPRRRFSLSNLDMPWLGVCDLRRGFGYAIIAETPDDGYIEMTTAGPRLVWTASKREFRYPRRWFYYFAPRGGYVALAKRYRSYAQKIGILIPFSEKLKQNPNIARLFGAPDVWGDPTLAFARQAKEAGVEKMLHHTSPSSGRRTGVTPAEMKAINELGYLSSTYDNYTDVMPLEPGQQVDQRTDRVPESVVLKADGQRMTAWLTWDKKQFMKRCPTLWVPAARIVIPKDLAVFPYLGRFIDVTTAEDLYECYDPHHPLTRTDHRQKGVELLAYVRSLGLVTGGEHGRWWAVPYLDYIEGMMSGGFYSWPAGHLMRPKSKTQEFSSPWGRPYAKWEDYEKWGIGHQYRVPLWELVFHDCIVTTWYWGDSNDFLLEAAPEVTPKKDAFNVLYGSMPMLWANKQGSWQANRDVFLRTYRNVCKLHEVIATAEMLSHEFLTPDRAVQRTRFSDGTEVVVNFGEKPFPVRVGGRAHLLPQNGFAVKGPRIEQYLELVDGRVVTTIRAGKFRYTNGQ